MSDLPRQAPPQLPGRKGLLSLAVYGRAFARESAPPELGVVGVALRDGERADPRPAVLRDQPPWNHGHNRGGAPVHPAAGERPRGGAGALPAEAPEMVRIHLKLAAERVELGVDGGGAGGVDGFLEAAQAAI